MSKTNLFFKGFVHGFRNFSHTITNTINFFLLLIVYILGIGLVSIISKLFGRHYLDLKKSGSKSNWREHKITKELLEKYYRTF